MMTIVKILIAAYALVFLTLWVIGFWNRKPLAKFLKYSPYFMWIFAGLLIIGAVVDYPYEIIRMKFDILSKVNVIVILVLIAFRDGYLNKWGLEKDKEKVKVESARWHKLGLLIRMFIVILMFLQTEDWWWTGAAAFLCWIPYNVIINLCNGWKAFYFGQTSWIDRLINKIF